MRKNVTGFILTNMQLFIAILLTLIGIALLFCGFWIDPQGEIDGSVLVAFGEGEANPDPDGRTREDGKEERRPWRTKIVDVSNGGRSGIATLATLYPPLNPKNQT